MTSAPDLPPRHVFLAPGAVYCAGTPALVTTILGSCIAICLWDRRLRAGGINHYVLPSGGAAGNLRYGNAAMARLFERMGALGSRVDDLRAKVFGGAAVLPFGEEQTVGERNLQVALEGLRQRGIPVVAQRTGGESGLFLRFHTASGEVMVRALRRESPAA